MMSASERIENAEASCESINEHIDSIGEFWKIVQREFNFWSPSASWKVFMSVF